ncbi:uncharacterized protein [Panulirus ornatus]|uniref:uncharacterized protein n=1 Tax=Panulirus ornatus TaxID=150431 RepID=UPI003A8AACEE
MKNCNGPTDVPCRTPLVTPIIPPSRSKDAPGTSVLCFLPLRPEIISDLDLSASCLTKVLCFGVTCLSVQVFQRCRLVTLHVSGLRHLQFSPPSADDPLEHRVSHSFILTVLSQPLHMMSR